MDKAPGQLIDSESRKTVETQGAILRSQAALLSRPKLGDAAAALAVELAELFRCTRVSISLLAKDELQLVGDSRATAIDVRQSATAGILAAMNEALDQRASISWPALDGDGPPISLAQRLLAGTGAACSVPLVGTDGVVGVMTLERGEPPFELAEVAMCEDIASFCGPVLEVKQRAEQPWHQAIAARLKTHLATPRRKRLGWMAALLALALTLALPMPWRISAPARLEGSVQRAVVAAADGFVQQANVRAGDRVEAGQVLVQLSSQDLELERRRRESEVRQHENAYRAAQSRNDRTQMVISQSRAAEAQALLTLAESQLERAHIKAPFSGVVIRGDLSQTLGAPVQKGEVLLVLAPNDSFRLILEVDESDIAAVEVGQPGTLALAAQSDRLLDFTVRRVVPVATAADGRNYFEVEGALDASHANMRPGLSGVAKIEAGRRSVLWLLTHRAVAWLRLALWTVGP